MEAERVEGLTKKMVGAKEERRDIKQDMTTILEDFVGI